MYSCRYPTGGGCDPVHLTYTHILCIGRTKAHQSYRRLAGAAPRECYVSLAVWRSPPQCMHEEAGSEREVKVLQTEGADAAKGIDAAIAIDRGGSRQHQAAEAMTSTLRLRHLFSLRSEACWERGLRYLFGTWLFALLVWSYILVLLGSTSVARREAASVTSVVYLSLIVTVVLLILQGFAGDLAASVRGRRRERICGTSSCMGTACLVLLVILLNVIGLTLPINTIYINVLFEALWFPAHYINLDFGGWIGGLMFVLGVLTCCGCCMCCLGCCGWSRAAKRWSVSMRRSGIFVDLVENRAKREIVTPLIFLYAFAIPSAMLLAGTALIGPSNALGTTPGAPESLSLLCQSPLALLVQNQYARTTGVRPVEAWLAFDTHWRMNFEPLADPCEAEAPPDEANVTSNASRSRSMHPLFSAPVPARTLPPLRLVVRDTKRIGVPGVVLLASLGHYTGYCNESKLSSGTMEGAGVG